MSNNSTWLRSVAILLVLWGSSVRGQMDDCQREPFKCGWTMDPRTPVKWIYDPDTGNVGTERCSVGSCGLARLFSVPFDPSSSQVVTSFRFRYLMHGDSRVYLRLTVQKTQPRLGVKMRLWERWASWGRRNPHEFQDVEVTVPSPSSGGLVQLVLEANILFAEAFVVLGNIRMANRGSEPNTGHKPSTTTSVSAVNKEIAVTESATEAEETAVEEDSDSLEELDNTDSDLLPGTQRKSGTTVDMPNFQEAANLPEDESSGDNSIESEQALNNGYIRAVFPKLCPNKDREN